MALCCVVSSCVRMDQFAWRPNTISCCGDQLSRTIHRIPCAIVCVWGFWMTSPPNRSVWSLSHYAIASYKAVADREPHNRFYKDVVKIITRLCALSLSLLGPLFSLCKNSPRDDLPRDPRIAWWVQTIRSARGLRTGKKIHSDAKRTTFTHLGTERWQYRKYIWNTRQTHIIYCCVMRCD